MTNQQINTSDPDVINWETFTDEEVAHEHIRLEEEAAERAEYRTHTQRQNEIYTEYVSRADEFSTEVDRRGIEVKNL